MNLLNNFGVVKVLRLIIQSLLIIVSIKFYQIKFIQLVQLTLLKLIGSQENISMKDL